MFSLLVSFTASALAAPLPNDDGLVLVTFANHSNTTYKWWEQNDPVMGGQSYGNFTVEDRSCGDSYGKFQGDVKIVPFLKAPGFCRATTGSIIIKDAKDFLEGGLELTVRSPSQVADPFKGFKLAFSAVGVPHHHGGHEVTGMFKADFVLPAATEPTDWQFVTIPFSKFSWDWSDATGECSTKDSDGYQHQCCTGATPKFCPTAKQLSLIDGFSIWAEGTAGVFDLEVFMIAATKSSATSRQSSRPLIC